MAEQEKRPTVRVACSIVNGLVIQLKKYAEYDKTQIINDGGQVKLEGPRPLDTGVNNTGGPSGVTEVDAEWWAAWAEQNKLNPLLTSGGIRALEEPAK